VSGTRAKRQVPGSDVRSGALPVEAGLEIDWGSGEMKPPTSTPIETPTPLTPKQDKSPTRTAGRPSKLEGRTGSDVRPGDSLEPRVPRPGDIVSSIDPAAALYPTSAPTETPTPSIPKQDKLKTRTAGRPSKLEERTWQAYLSIGSMTGAWSSDTASRQCFRHALRMAEQFQARWGERGS